MTGETSQKTSSGVIGTLLIAGAVLGGAVAGLAIFHDANDDDDRPPIIVRNGSVIIETSISAGNGARGRLEAITGQKAWYHLHDGKEPKNLAVLVSGLDPNTAGCSTAPYFFAQRAKKVTVTYSYGGGDRTLVFEIVKKGGDDTVRVTADAGATVSPTGDYKLEFDGAGNNLKSVKIEHRNKDNADRAPICTFTDGKGQVTILQRK